MPEERTEIGKFLVGVKIFETLDGNHDYERYILSNGAYPEEIIMQLKSILQQLEQEYFDSFNKPFS